MGLAHVARQPVYDGDHAVHGYELLFRARWDADAAGDHDHDAMTTRLLVSTFTDFGLASLVGDRLAFVNVTRPFVSGALEVPFAPGSAVLEVLETVPADEEVLRGCRALVEQGYRLALDDFAFEPERMALLPLAEYVKVDVTGRSEDDLRRAVAMTRGAGALALAEKVETAEQVEACRALGFDLFQGYGLLRPRTLTTPTVSPSTARCLQLLSRLSDPEVGVADVEDVVRSDLALGYRVLHAANSAASGPARRVGSIRDALVLLGLQRLRSWLLLMVLADAGGGDVEQLSAATTRARTCELLAAELPGARPDSAFVVGVISGLEVVLGVPTAEVVARLPLADELRAALVEHAGPLGAVLRTVLAHERGDEAVLERSPFGPFEVSRAYLAAVGWSLELRETALQAA